MLEKWKVSEDQKKKLRNLKLEGPCLDSIELKKKKNRKNTIHVSL